MLIKIDVDAVLLGDSARHGSHLRGEAGTSHVAGDMTHAWHVLAHELNLRAEFALHLLESPGVFRDRAAGIILVGPQHREEVAVRISQTWTARNRAPFHVVP